MMENDDGTVSIVTDACFYYSRPTNGIITVGVQTIRFQGDTVALDRAVSWLLLDRRGSLSMMPGRPRMPTVVVSSSLYRHICWTIACATGVGIVRWKRLRLPSRANCVVTRFESVSAINRNYILL